MADPEDRITLEELRARMQNFEPEMRALVQERLDHHFHRDLLVFLSQQEASLVWAMARRLIPQDWEPSPDLVSFFDWAATQPLGQGDRLAGQPDLAAMFHQGLQGVHQTAQALYGDRDFLQLTGEEQDAVLRAVQEGQPPGEVWRTLDGRRFFIEFYRRLLAGWLADPATWCEIGFPGPAYPEGYLWISCHHVRRRHQRKGGYLWF